MELLKVIGEGQRSNRKYIHLKHAMQKAYTELLEIEDESEDNENRGNLESARMTNDTNVQVFSNLNFTLQDPPNIVSRGRPKTLRQKHPKESQGGKNKRKCGICKQIGHVRTRCPSQDQAGISNTANLPSMLLHSSSNECPNEGLSPTSLYSPACISSSSQRSHPEDSISTIWYTCPSFGMPQEVRPSSFMDLMNEAMEKHS